MFRALIQFLRGRTNDEIEDFSDRNASPFSSSRSANAQPPAPPHRKRSPSLLRKTARR